MSIQRHFILFILSLLVITPSIAHQKPYVINFARDKYHAANKNWTIGQDEKGITYFGNDIGLLEFDGIEWKIYQMPNFSLIRSLAVESHSTIYVGALGDGIETKQVNFNILLSKICSHLKAWKMKVFGVYG